MTCLRRSCIDDEGNWPTDNDQRLDEAGSVSPARSSHAIRASGSITTELYRSLSINRSCDRREELFCKDAQTQRFGESSAADVPQAPGSGGSKDRAMMVCSSRFLGRQSENLIDSANEEISSSVSTSGSVRAGVNRDSGA